ncbi:MAG: hypothetical protein EOP54_19700, partial [Sphingobacteriales bacterium]
MNKKIIVLATVFCSLISMAYARNEQVKISNIETDRGRYEKGQDVYLTLTLSGKKAGEISLSRLTTYLQNLETGQRVPGEVTVAGNIRINTKGYTVKNMRIWTVPAEIPPGPYAIMLVYEFGVGNRQTAYGTFFRVGDKALTCFDIAVDSYQGMKVFKLDGGMSAEYAVEKAA